jgi:ADP-heptose:LPS heptosyltransferase
MLQEAPKIKRFLIIRFSSIGDIVLTTPVVRNLKLHFTDNAEIYYLTKRGFKPILEKNPYIDRILTIDRDVNEVSEQLEKIQFDYVIDLHKNLRTFKVKRMLRKPAFSYDKLNIQKWLMVNFKIDRLPKMHIVDRYMATLKPWNIPNDKKGLDYLLGPNDSIGDFPKGFPKNYIAVSVGAAHPTKTLPAYRLRTLLSNLKLAVVLLGDENDVEKANQIKQDLDFPIWNTCGKYTLNQSAWLIQHSKVVIAHDTGIMHIAAAFKKPVISLWGNTVPEFGMYPYIPSQPSLSKIFEVKDLSCRPCSKIGFDACPKKHFKCMRDIDLMLVSNAVKKAFQAQKDL